MLRPNAELYGHKLATSGGAIGQLTVEAGPWSSGKESMISAGDVECLSYPDTTVFVNFSPTTIPPTAEHALTKPAAYTNRPKLLLEPKVERGLRSALGTRHGQRRAAECPPYPRGRVMR